MTVCEHDCLTPFTPLATRLTRIAQVGRVALPVGVAVNFTINSRKFVIPMAVEEPSVGAHCRPHHPYTYLLMTVTVAAASNSAKLVQKYSKVGFEAGATRSLMIAQIEIRGLSDIQSVSLLLLAVSLSLPAPLQRLCSELKMQYMIVRAYGRHTQRSRQNVLN